MAEKRGRGWPTVYQGKAKRYQGSVTPEGAKAFERARATLMDLTKLMRVSDGDVMEFLALGGTVAASSAFRARQR